MSTQNTKNYYEPTDSSGDNKAHFEGSLYIGPNVSENKLTVTGEQINEAAGISNNILKTNAANKEMVFGTHTVTAGEASDGFVDFSTGLASIDSAIAQIVDADKNDKTAGFEFDIGASVFSVGSNGGSLLVAGDIIRWFAAGNRAVVES